jgi:predicted LPLAT superfamily acyltransferase
MRADSTPMPQAPDLPANHWAARRERGHLGLMRLMAWTAMWAGRRLSRLILHPITLYFLLTAGEARRQSRRYLARALGRPATWADSYRHVHAFAATVLDRIYFLRGRLDAFEVTSTGQPEVIARLEQGEGAFLIGAHMGSFEALRALGEDDGRRVAMVMYEDNARLINATLAAIAPQAGMRLIPLGRAGAMLSLRQWLDDGGIAGLLADRTLPGPAGASARSKTTWLPFLGEPARFSDGPFRLAAMLRRPVFFMIGLYHGGPRYELRFVPLADFGSVARGDAPAMEAAIAEAQQRYVAQLESLCREAPCNWFNFYDFWADAAEVPAAASSPPPGRHAA